MIYTELRVFQRGVDSGKMIWWIPNSRPRSSEKSRLRSSEKSGNKGPFTQGPILSHMRWEMVPDTHLQKIHGPMGGEKWSQQLSKCPIHRFIDPVDRSRLISTVDKDSPTGEYGWYQRSTPIHLRRITVDRRSSIRIRDIVVDFIDEHLWNPYNDWDWNSVFSHFLSTVYLTRLLGESCDQKNVVQKLVRNREILVVWAVGMWVHRDIWLGAKIGVSLKTEYKVLNFLVHLLRSAWSTLGQDFWKYPRSLQ